MQVDEDCISQQQVELLKDAVHPFVTPKKLPRFYGIKAADILTIKRKFREYGVINGGCFSFPILLTTVLHAVQFRENRL